ncbi:hypothetical protein GCM10023094_17310 [Rhodococcus olei]|uniref:Integral membrane protein n=1 Tax=Rhodococcus olei TaxID=2161675 RepID=A0ABP8P0H0_9NOCA
MGSAWVRAATAAVRVTASTRPVAGAAAMSFGIVSIALHVAGFDTLSLPWLVLGIVTWAALVVVAAGRLVLDRPRWMDESRTPAALTGVAATTVLGTRLSLLGRQAAALIVAVVAWLVLTPSVLRGRTTPTVGASFLLCVATQGPVVLAATLAVATGRPWLTVAATAFFGLGLCCYVVVVVRFDVRQLALAGR